MLRLEGRVPGHRSPASGHYAPSNCTTQCVEQIPADCRIAMTSRAICLGISKDISIAIEDRKDLHETTQVIATIEMGAVRTEGSLIQKVQTTI